VVNLAVQNTKHLPTQRDGGPAFEGPGLYGVRPGTVELLRDPRPSVSGPPSDHTHARDYWFGHGFGGSVGGVDAVGAVTGVPHEVGAPSPALLPRPGYEPQWARPRPSAMAHAQFGFVWAKAPERCGDTI
jgi:hypothetical protein